MTAIQTYLVSLIKTKQFKEALGYLNNLPLKDQLVYEHAYILHRAGENKEALAKLKSSGDQSTSQYRHLLSQINYKLFEYEKSVKQYQEILEQDAHLDQDEIGDIATNYLAC
jgi:tetratricopeptide (TPR) repeat protein